MSGMSDYLHRVAASQFLARRKKHLVIEEMVFYAGEDDGSGPIDVCMHDDDDDDDDDGNDDGDEGECVSQRLDERLQRAATLIKKIFPTAIMKSTHRHDQKRDDSYGDSDTCDDADHGDKGYDCDGDVPNVSVHDTLLRHAGFASVIYSPCIPPLSSSSSSSRSSSSSSSSPATHAVYSSSEHCCIDF
jgi:hypothetical protein